MPIVAVGPDGRVGDERLGGVYLDLLSRAANVEELRFYRQALFVGGADRAPAPAPVSAEPEPGGPAS